MVKRIVLSGMLLLGVFLVGCGVFGGGGEDLEFETLVFEDVPPTPTPPVEDVVASIGLEPVLLVRLRYLYSHQVRLETLRRLGRDLQRLVEYSSESAVGLDWVIEVHEVTEETDEVVLRATRAGIPESQRDQYEYLFVGLLRVMDVMQYGSARLLEAATVIGPSGRTLDTMNGAERERFVTLVREAERFLAEGEEMLADESKGTNGAISRLGLR